MLAFHIARRYLISKIEKTTNLKNAAVAKALNKDSAQERAKLFTYQRQKMTQCLA
jgi:hypothetical protein